jgi:CheY-like chemotaxis protein
MLTRYRSRNKPRVLVVDDDQMTTRMFGEILEKNGYEVATALSGEQAVARAARFAPDLLVSDLGAVAMAGIKAATRITEMIPGCRVLLLSCHASMSDVSAAVPQRLVYSFTTKPLHPLDLLNVIAYMLPCADSVDDPVLRTVDPDRRQKCGNNWN